MTQDTAFGEALMDGYIKVNRAATGLVEYYHVVEGVLNPITAEEYAAAHQEDGCNG